MHKLIITAASVLLALGCNGPDETVDPTTTSNGGKGDRIVTVEQCDAFIADYDPNPCGEFDEITATLEQTQEHLVCLEAVAEDDLSAECCGLSEFEGSQFCADALERGYQFLCDAAITDFDRCILDSESFGGACHGTFHEIYSDPPKSCCDRVESWACDRPQAPDVIEDQAALEELFQQQAGYFWQTPAFDRMYAVDILPENLQNSLAIHDDPFRNDRLDPSLPADEQLALHEIVERIPVQYGVHRYLADRNPIWANAYVTFWRTAADDVALIVHAFNPNVVATSSAYGWQDVTWGILEDGPCDVMSDSQVAGPGLAELSFSLDFTAGHPDDTCLGAHFTEVSPDDDRVRRPIAELLYELGSVVGDDSRISTATRAWVIETANFSGYLIEATEELSAEDRELFGDGYVPPSGRFLLDHRGDPLRVYDDQACERGPTYVNRAECFMSTF